MGNLTCRRYNIKIIKIHDNTSSTSSSRTSSISQNTNTPNSSDLKDWLDESNKGSILNNCKLKEIFYEEGQLGTGGFSTVLLATRKITEKKQKPICDYVAIKQISCGDKESLTNARREIEITSKISSENVIKLLTNGERKCSKNPHNTIVSLVFPVYSSGTLWDYLIRLKSQSESLSGEQKRCLCIGILNGMKACHNLNIAHCDLKTSNILLKNDLKTPIIMDFGSATTDTIKHIKTHNDLQCLQDWAAQHCTACYRAPELFDVEYPIDLDLRSCDIWSIGCCIRALTHYHGPLDEIWLKNDSLGLAVQSIGKYIGEYKDCGEFTSFDDVNATTCLKSAINIFESDLIYKNLVEKCLLASGNITRPSVDDLLKMLPSE